MATTTETILLQVDISANNSRLVELQKQLLDNKAALAALNTAFKENRLSADDLAAGQVRLKQEAANVATEQRALTKANQAQEAANKAQTGSIEQLRAQLALGTAEYNKLSQAQRDDTDAGQRLQAQNKATSDQLKVLEAAIGDTRRNVGNYAASIDPLIQQLVKLQEQQKKIPEGSAAYQQAQVKVIGFQQAVNDAGVKAGLSYEQTQAKLKAYGDAIQPATAKLVQLEEEQKKVGAGSVEYAKIGFQIGKAAKEIEKVPAEVAKVSDSVKTGFQSALSKGLAPFQNELDRGTGLLGKFKSGSDLVNQGLGLLKGSGETGALGFKSLAAGIALTGIGLFVLAISAVVTYFAQTAEGGRILAGILGGLGGVIQVAADAVTTFGKGIVEAVTNPRKALDDFVQFFEDQVTNRFKAFGVILKAIQNGNVYQLTNGVAQLATGVEDVNGKLGRLGTKLKDAYDAAATFAGREKDLAKARRELEKEDAQAESRVAVLLRLSKERGKTAADQLDSLKEAGRIENQLSEDRIKQSKKELDLVNDRIKAAGAAKKGELIADKQAKELEIIRAETQQNETNARIQVRESVFREQQRKAAADAAQKAREDAVRAQQTLAEQLLLGVEKDGAAELVIRQRLVQLAADAEIASAKKTADEKQLIQAKANVEIQNLAAVFAQKQLEIAKKRTEAQNKELLREYAEAQKLLEDSLNQKRARVESDLANRIITENEAQRQLNAIDKAGYAVELVNAKDYGQAQGAILKKQGDNEIKEATRVKNEKKKIKDVENNIVKSGIEAAETTADLVADALGRETAAGQAALAIKKVLALAEIAVNLERQLSLNAIAADEIKLIPVVGPALGTAYEITEDALAIAAAAASAAKILGFQTGGLVPGQGSGDIVPALLEPGEAVMTKGAVQQFAPVLSYLNTLAGGVSFAPGLPQQRSGQIDGGLVARALGAAPALDYQQLANAIAQQPISVDVRAIATQQGRVARARSLTALS